VPQFATSIVRLGHGLAPLPFPQLAGFASADRFHAAIAFDYEMLVANRAASIVVAEDQTHR
jgi:hypothetical protein